MALILSGGPTLIMGHVQTLPGIPDPATMALLEVGHSTAITVNAGKSQGTGWTVWVRQSPVFGEIVVIETWISRPGEDWWLQNVESFQSKPVNLEKGGVPFQGTSFTNEDFPAGTQLLINCTRCDSANWLYIAVATG